MEEDEPFRPREKEEGDAVENGGDGDKGSLFIM